MQRTSLKRERIDWQKVRSRLDASSRAAEQALIPSAQRMEDAYRRRAIKLAQTDRQNLRLSVGLPVLVFRLGQERYAIEMKHLAEVLPLGYYSPVPRSPPHFLGVISVRGDLRAVIDLQRLLALSSDGSSTAGLVLMLRPRAGNEQMGFKVDSIEEICEIRPEELTRQRPPGA